MSWLRVNEDAWICGSSIMSRVYSVVRVLMVLLVISAGLAACGGQNSGASPAAAGESAEPGAAGKPKVVATFSVLGDLVQNVAGDRVELVTLVPAGGDAHTFEPSPNDSVALAEAALIVETGLEFESWLPELFAASGSRARRVAVTEGVELIEVVEEEHDENAEEDAEEQSELDPHVWHDVANAIHMVERIRDGLVALDAPNAGAYRASAGDYIQRLRELDAFVVERVAGLPVERRKLVTTHDTFAYFARRYGFELLGTTLGSVSTEVADPSAADIVALVEEIKAAGVPAIFTENIESAGITERVALEAGVRLVPSLYTDSLGEPGGDGDSYEKMVRYNVETIVEALAE